VIRKGIITHDLNQEAAQKAQKQTGLAILVTTGAAVVQSTASVPKSVVTGSHADAEGIGWFINTGRGRPERTSPLEFRICWLPGIIVSIFGYGPLQSFDPVVKTIYNSER
jgi:hypothetical protein